VWGQQLVKRPVGAWLYRQALALELEGIVGNGRQRVSLRHPLAGLRGRTKRQGGGPLLGKWTATIVQRKTGTGRGPHAPALITPSLNGLPSVVIEPEHS